jgi:hypothetical protein
VEWIKHAHRDEWEMPRSSNFIDYPPKISNAQEFDLQPSERSRIARSTFGKQVSDGFWEEVLSATNRYTDIDWRKRAPSEGKSRNRFVKMKPQADSETIRKGLASFIRSANLLRSKITGEAAPQQTDINLITTEEIHDAYFSDPQHPIRALAALYRKHAKRLPLDLSHSC